MKRSLAFLSFLAVFTDLFTGTGGLSVFETITLSEVYVQ
jgi:hypothetical protein